MTDLWSIMGLSHGAVSPAVREAYETQRQGHDDPAALRYACKVLMDPFYRSTYTHYPRDLQVLKDAGFFDDGLAIGHKPGRWDVRWLTTPVHKIVASLEGAEAHAGPLAVLVTTGAFSPIHDGHLVMMEQARVALEARGTRVVGGYFSLSHDGYVSTKCGGTAAMPAEHRIVLCEKAVAASPWLMVDSWEARYNDAPINFTDVLLRLEAYLAAHLSVPVELHYVFGGDNAGFARAFVENGHCVCIARPGYESQLSEIVADPLLRSERILLATDLKGISSSSTAVRGGDYTHLPRAICEDYRSWQGRADRCDAVNESNLYVLRDDLAWATQAWNMRYDAQRLAEAAQVFKESFCHDLSGAFTHVSAPDTASPKQIVYYDLAEQQQFARELEQRTPVLCMDVCTDAAYRLDISRQFGISDGQCFSELMVERPGTSELMQQFRCIPAGDYTLVEDDIASGRTIQLVRNLLPDHVSITDIVTLAQFSFYQCYPAEHPYAFYDIVDLRDFLVGATAGGLVVGLPNGNVARVPYMLPYVSPVSRAKIPPSAAYELSLHLWELNLAFFTAIPVCIGDTDPAFQALARYLGFSARTSMAEFCSYHVTQLKSCETQL